MVRLFFHTRALILSLSIFYFAAASFGAPQTPQNAHSGAVSQQGVYVVFPFENAGAFPRLDWLGEGLEELTIQYLSSAGEEVYTHEGRTAELERNGFPFSAKLSRATMLRIAQELDADFVIFGSFTSDGKSLTVEARVLRVEPTTLLPAARESSSLEALMELHTKVVWKLLNSVEGSQRLPLADFAKAQRPLRLDAFEHYIRGLLANDDQARLRELREASRLDTNWPDPAFALGETYFTRNDCNSALPWFAHVPRKHDRYVEASFDTGVCRLQMNQASQAEEVFTSLQAALAGNRLSEQQAGTSGVELPEILNNLAVARARLGKTPAAESDLRKATDLDPDEDDYPFNLGVLAYRAGKFAEAAEHFREASERRPENLDDRAFLVQALEKAGKKAEADQEREDANEALGPNALPTGRTEAKTPASHIRRGRQDLSAGKIDTAEAEFHSVLLGDPRNAAAHRGLAEINRRRGKLDDAVKELQASLQARDSAVVRITLARVYLEQKKPELARAEVQRALKLAPNYSEAKELLEHLQNGKSSGGAQ
ncbi:MAG: hypothetical protein AUG89_13870 [Acidobacteria bacterium 13_1_20CM_4_56_7]|nr:MAG: hypothetical protein AUG89_13870 [Acidobacteria bacterium 13_1_20CM_4_56_7]